MQPSTIHTNTTTTTATEILKIAINEMADRAKQRDASEDPNSPGERSMSKTVAMFNALKGKDLTEADGWTFMICLKLARAEQGLLKGVCKLDDFVDGAAYFSLLGESVVN